MSISLDIRERVKLSLLTLGQSNMAKNKPMIELSKYQRFHVMTTKGLSL
jgi:hypothetical protein